MVTVRHLEIHQQSVQRFAPKTRRNLEFTGTRQLCHLQLLSSSHQSLQLTIAAITKRPPAPNPFKHLKIMFHSASKTNDSAAKIAQAVAEATQLTEFAREFISSSNTLQNCKIHPTFEKLSKRFNNEADAKGDLQGEWFLKQMGQRAYIREKDWDELELEFQAESREPHVHFCRRIPRLATGFSLHEAYSLDANVRAQRSRLCIDVLLPLDTSRVFLGKSASGAWAVYAETCQEARWSVETLAHKGPNRVDASSIESSSINSGRTNSNPAESGEREVFISHRRISQLPPPPATNLAANHQMNSCPVIVGEQLNEELESGVFEVATVRVPGADAKLYYREFDFGGLYSSSKLEASLESNHDGWLLRIATV